MSMQAGSPADNYWPERCAACSGTGKHQIDLKLMNAKPRLTVAQIADQAPSCVVCGGNAFVLVLQPAQKCRQCGGTGRSFATRCLHCKGTGWMFVQKEEAGFLR